MQQILAIIHNSLIKNRLFVTRNGDASSRANSRPTCFIFAHAVQFSANEMLLTFKAKLNYVSFLHICCEHHNSNRVFDMTSARLDCPAFFLHTRYSL